MFFFISNILISFGDLFLFIFIPKKSGEVFLGMNNGSGLYLETNASYIFPNIIIGK
jgi:hypothetical protein